MSVRCVRHVLLLAAVVGLAGCGSGGGSGGSSSSSGGLTSALGAVADSPVARAYFEYADVKALRALADAPDTLTGTPPRLDRPWSRVLGVGAAPFAASPQIARATHIDYLRADRAITIGQPPAIAFRLDGPLDGQAVRAYLLAHGAKQQGGLLATGAEGSIDATGPLAGLGILNQLDRVAIRSGTFAAGPRAAPVTAILGGSKALGEDPTYAEAASCLGDVVDAVILPAGTPPLGLDGTLVAIGERHPASGTAAIDEVTCLIGDETEAKKAVAGLRRGTAPGSGLPGTGQPVRALVAKTTIDQPSPRAARAVMRLRPGRPAGFLYGALQRGGLEALFGACPLGPHPTRARARLCAGQPTD